MRKQLGPVTSGASDAVTRSFVDWIGVVKTAAYSMTIADELILADTTSGGFTITLPTAVGANRMFKIKKIAAPNTLTIGSVSGTIDGSASIAITVQYTSLDFVSDGTNWFVV